MTDLIPVPEFMREAAAVMAEPWFVRCDTGPFAVHSVGAAGSERVEFTGFHYPYQALAKADDLNEAAHYAKRMEVFFAVNTDDPETDVESADEAYWADLPRLCENDNDRICSQSCGEVCAREELV